MITENQLKQIDALFLIESLIDKIIQEETEEDAQQALDMLYATAYLVQSMDDTATPDNYDQVVANGVIAAREIGC